MNAAVPSPGQSCRQRRRPFSSLAAQHTPAVVKKPLKITMLTLGTPMTSVRRPCHLYQQKPRRRLSKQTRTRIRSLNQTISKCSDLTLTKSTPGLDESFRQSWAVLRAEGADELQKLTHYHSDEFLHEALEHKAALLGGKTLATPKVWLVPKPVLNRTLQRKFRRLSL